MPSTVGDRQSRPVAAEACPERLGTIIEALAQAKADGRADELPKLIICPHETVALSAAHAYAMVTDEPQAVVVHVDSGTQNVGGMVNNGSVLHHGGGALGWSGGAASSPPSRCIRTAWRRQPVSSRYRSRRRWTCPA